MIEIIIAIIIQISTIVGGGDLAEEKGQNKEKDKTEKSSKDASSGAAEGGAGNWEG